MKKLLFLVLTLLASPLYPQGGITQPSAGFANPMTGADQLIGSGSSVSGTPSAVSLLNCATALTYSTSTHLFGCNAAAAGVSSITGDGTIITNSASVGAVTLTIAGISGGVPYFNSNTGWASSALLTQNVLVKGGGAGAAPSNSSITDNGTTITTAESILVSGASSQIGLNNSGGAALTMPTGTSIYAFGTTPRFVSGGIAGAGFFSAVRWDGTVGSPTAVQANDQIGGFNSWAYNGTTLNGPIGSFRCFANQNQTGAAAGSYCDVATTPNGTTTQAEVIRFENDAGITVPNTVAGGDKGAGTINAAGLFVAGVAVLTSSSGVSSFSGDGTLLSNSASTGAVTATLANAGALTVLGNRTGSGAAPTYTSSPIISGIYRSQQTALGTTSADGFYAINTTAAAAGAQQVCPSYDMAGNGWGTTGGASQPVNFRINCLPVQGTVPTAILQFQSSINNGAFSNLFTMSTAGGNSTLSAGTSNLILATGATNDFVMGTSFVSVFQPLNFGSTTSASNPGLTWTAQTNPILQVKDANGGTTAQLAVGNCAPGGASGNLCAAGLTTVNGGLASSSASITLSGLGSATGTPNALCLNGTTVTVNAALTCTVSNELAKNHFVALQAGTKEFMAILPAQFEYNDIPGRIRWGFGAMQVAGVNRALADGWKADGMPWSLDQNAILALTVKQLQTVTTDVQRLKEVRQ